MKRTSMWPKPTQQDKELEYTVNTDFLVAVRNSLAKKEIYMVTRDVEAVLLHAEKIKHKWDDV
jgi:hypothetical protein